MHKKGSISLKLKNCNFMFLPLLAILVLVGYSCARPAYFPQFDLSHFSKERLVEELKQKDRLVSSVKGIARISITTPDHKTSFRQITIAKAPDLIYLEALSPIGTTLGMLKCNGSTVEVAYRNERMLFDKNEQFNVSLLYPGIPITARADDLVNLLLGRVPHVQEIRAEDVELSSERGLLVLKAINEGIEEGYAPESIWLDPLNHSVIKAYVRMYDGRMATYQFGDHKKEVASGIYFPLSIELEVEGLSLKVKYEPDIEVNESTEEVFAP